MSRVCLGILALLLLPTWLSAAGEHSSPSESVTDAIVTDPLIAGTPAWWLIALFTLNGRLWMQLASGGSFANYDSGYTVADGEWHLVAATVTRGTTNDVRFYVDGALVNTVSYVTPTGPGSSSRFGA